MRWAVRSDRGLANRMRATGRLTRLVDDDDIAAAVEQAPEDTRAWFRGAVLRRYPDEVVAASWDSVIVEVPGQRQLQRIPMLEPLRGTRAQLGDLVESSTSMGELLKHLSAPRDPAARTSR